MILKQVPEDFVVNERISLDIVRERPEGDWFSIYRIKKRMLSTEEVVEILCRRLGISRRGVGYAGLKDKKAITTQYFSLKKTELKGEINNKVSYSFEGYSKRPISIGSLEGNEFRIVVRGLDKDVKIVKADRFPNYFDKQRFSSMNAEIGKALVKKDYNIVVDLLKKDKEKAMLINRHLETVKNDFVGAIKRMPLKILKLYIHAFQSRMFNKLLEEYPNDKELPLIGFATEETDAVKKILKAEGVSLKDFVNRQIPELTMEGGVRNAYAEIYDLKISKIYDDELNTGKYKVLLSFFLKKGCYATEAVKHIIFEE